MGCERGRPFPQPPPPILLPNCQLKKNHAEKRRRGGGRVATKGTKKHKRTEGKGIGFRLQVIGGGGSLKLETIKPPNYQTTKLSNYQTIPPFHHFRIDGRGVDGREWRRHPGCPPRRVDGMTRTF